MDNELRFFLEKGPTKVQELVRLTGKSKSTLYKALKHEDVLTQESDKGRLYFVKPTAPTNEAPPEPNSNGAGASAEASTPETPAPANDVAPGPSKRGRKAIFGGKQLYPDAALLGTNDNGQTPTYQNPRRKNSAGFKSLQLVIDRPGITTEDFVTAGGRLNDLRWDVAHGHVRAE